MWYVVQVQTGQEENMRLQCEANLSPEVMEQCFVLYYEERKRIGGAWITEKKKLFPGYLFLVSEQPEQLFLQLKKVIGLAKLLKFGDDIIPLTEAEIDFLKRVGGREQVVSVSEGIIEDSQVRILSGPLVGMEGMIKKIDRHKRKAWLDVEMFGRVQRVEIGLEIVRKTESLKT